jgi:ketosteroid isomerase-like protein
MTAKTTLIDIYDAWRAKDFDWLGTYLPADFRHSMNIPIETLALGGTRDGKGAALDRLREIFQVYDTRHFEVGKLIVEADRASVEVTTRCLLRGTGACLHTTKKHIWLLEDGWPVQLSEFYDLAEFDAFLKHAKAA